MAGQNQTKGRWARVIPMIPSRRNCQFIRFPAQPSCPKATKLESRDTWSLTEKQQFEKTHKHEPPRLPTSTATNGNSSKRALMAWQIHCRRRPPRAAGHGHRRRRCLRTPPPWNSCASWRPGGPWGPPTNILTPTRTLRTLACPAELDGANLENGTLNLERCRTREHRTSTNLNSSQRTMWPCDFQQCNEHLPNPNLQKDANETTPNL
jgi:hypothetical protein